MRVTMTIVLIDMMVVASYDGDNNSCVVIVVMTEVILMVIVIATKNIIIKCEISNNLMMITRGGDNETGINYNLMK